MDYIFGIVERNGVACENLKTVGDSHTALEGYQQTVREYEDNTITDRFRVLEHYRADEDAEGNCYDWYVIAEHYRYVDKTGPLETVSLDAAETTVDHEYRITLLELGVSM